MKRLVPRWLYQKVNLFGHAVSPAYPHGPPTPTLDRPWGLIPPTVFVNGEVFPFHLHWICVAGPVSASTGDWQTQHGGLGRRLTVQIGTSQWGWINEVESSLNAMMAPLYPVRSRAVNPTQFVNHSGGVALRFNEPVYLPAPSGLIAEVCNGWEQRELGYTDDYDEVQPGPAYYTRPSFCVHGFRQPRGTGREPSMIAGTKEWLSEKSICHIEASDKFNDGRSGMYLTDLVLDDGSITGVYPTDGMEEQGIYPTGIDDRMTRIRWRINPASGLPWMPDKIPIPACCIAPHNAIYSYLSVNDSFAVDRMPRVYEFPPNTILMPRQKVEVHLRELSGVHQTAHVSLFGVMEVGE